MPLLSLIFVVVTAGLMIWPIVLSPYFVIGFLCIFGCFHKALVLRIFSTVVIAIACVSVHLTWLESFTLSPMNEMRELQLSGQVIDLPERTEFGQRFHFSLKEFDGQKLPWWQSATVILSCYQKNCEVQAGERWQFTVKLKRPHGLVNFYGFDYEQYLFAHHIRASGSVVNNAPNHRLESSHHLAAYRQHSYQFLQQTQLPYINVIAGLSMGADDEIDPQIWDDLRRTGTTHLIAISGMHIVLIAVLVGAIVGWCWRIMRKPALWLATPYVQAIAGVLAATLYSAVAGFSVPTVRALLMTVLLALLLTRQRLWPPMTVLAVVAVIMLMIDPCSVLLPGFCLSFAAVAILLWRAHHRHSPSIWRQALVTQWWLSVGLMPLTLLLFDQVSIISAAVNLIAVPWVSFICTPLSLIGVGLISISPSLAQSVLWLADQSVQVFVVLNHSAAQLNWAIWQPPQLSWQNQFTIAFIVLLWLMPRALALKKWTAPLIGLLVVDLLFPKRPYAALTVLDVGQGLSITIETANKVSVYDAGPSSAKFNAGRDIVAPHLRALGFNQIDTAIISHADMDHAGGALALRDQFAIKQWRNGEAIKGLSDSFCRDGQLWTMDFAQFEVLAPSQSRDGNDASCVIKLTLLDTTFLLTGDLEKRGEAELLTHHHEKLASNALIVPHHGSRTSSTAAFVAAVKPQWAIISAGYLNRFGHPKPDIVARYLEHAAQVSNTANTGAIRWEWTNSNSSPQVRFARQAALRWREPLNLPSLIVR